MATAKTPGTSKKPLVDTPVEGIEQLSLEIDVQPSSEIDLGSEPTAQVEEQEVPAAIPADSFVAPVEAPVEAVAAPEAKVPFVGDQRTWHGAQTGQRYNARIQ